jgi:hypothetical protein
MGGAPPVGSTPAPFRHAIASTPTVLRPPASSCILAVRLVTERTTGHCKPVLSSLLYSWLHLPHSSSSHLSLFFFRRLFLLPCVRLGILVAVDVKAPVF